MKINHKWKVLLASAAAGSLLLSACGAGDPSQLQGNQEAKGEKPTEISIMTMFYSQEPPGESNSILQEIEKRTNTDLTITWISPNNYTEKMNVTLASGDLPDMMLVPDIFAPVIRTAAAQGAFWDINPHYVNYKHLAAFPKETWEYTRLEDGKNYGIPQVRPTGGGGFPFVRKDWLDKLGLPVPQTMDDIYTVWKAFVEKDPDGNGKNDTFGFAANVNQDNMGSLNWIFQALNNNNGGWKLVDGKLVDVNLLPGTREALIFLNKAFKEKLIPEDFAILKRSQAVDLLKANKAGMFDDSPEGAWQPNMEMLSSTPQANFLPLVSINGFTSQANAFNGTYVITKKIPEQKLKKILEFMDYGASDEAWDLINYGLKDTHHKEENGNKVYTELGTKELVTQGAFKQIFYKNDKYQKAFRNGMPNDIFERNKKIVDEREKISKPDISKGLYSETFLRVGAEWSKKIQDMKTKVIHGKEPVSAWDEFIKKMEADADFQKMTKEFNDSYQKRVSAK